MPGSMTLIGMSAGLPGGQVVDGPVTMTGANQIGAIVDVSLATGDNTFTVPTGAVMCSIFLGLATSVAVTMRSNLNSGDSGFPIAPWPGVQFVAIPLVTGMTSLILHAASAVANIEIRFK